MPTSSATIEVGPNRATVWLKENGFPAGMLLFMLAFPFLVAVLDGQSPVAVLTNETGAAKFMQGLMIEIFILAIYALSYDLVLGVTGLLSFGHAMFFAVGAYVTGIMLKSFGWGLGATLGAVVVAGVLQALLFSLVLPRVKGITFALVTLGMASVFHIVIQSNELVAYTGADVGLQGVIAPDFLNTTTDRFRFYLVSLAFTFLVYLFYRRFLDSPTGRVCIAIRENENRALMLGYNTFHFKVVILIIASITAALAGTLHTLHQPIVSPNIASLGYTVTALLIILIGGVGALDGAIIGAAVFRLLQFFLDKWFGESANIILGAVYIILVLFLPYGIVGTWRQHAFQIKAGRRRLLALLTGQREESPQAMTNMHQPAPKGLSIEQREQELRITLRWFKFAHVSVAVFALFYNVWLLSSVPSSPAIILFYACIPFGWIGLGLIYYTLVGFFNYTIICVTPTRLSVDHKPFPFFASTKQFAANDIKQLYIKQRIETYPAIPGLMFLQSIFPKIRQICSKSGIGRLVSKLNLRWFPLKISEPGIAETDGRYEIDNENEVWMIMNTGEHELFLSDVSNSQQAMRIKQIIEQFLDLQDTPVPDAFNPVDAQVARLDWNAWRNIPAEHRLSFIVSKFMRDLRLPGDYRLIISFLIWKTAIPGLAFLQSVLLKIYQISSETGSSASHDQDVPDASFDWSGWRNIAAEHGLSFTSGKFMRDFSLSGDYHGNKLTVSIFNDSYACRMRIALEPKGDIPTAAPIDKEEVKKRFEQWQFVFAGRVRREDERQTLIYEQASIETKQKNLQSLFDNLHDLLIIYPQIVRLGGEVVTIVAPFAMQKEDFIDRLLPMPFSKKNHPLRQIAVQILKDIAEQTRSLAPSPESLLEPSTENLYCRHCLTRCAAYPIDVGAAKIHYYGCRLCRQSRDFFTAKQAIAVLDDRLGPEPVQQEKSLRVNWLARRELFDFDRVEIIQATDEEVERFAVQVGNDTDSVRRPRYRRMYCLTAADCQLSQNTLRILQRTFGEVEVF